MAGGSETQRLVIEVTVNGVRHQRAVEPRLLLSDFLRHELGLTGTHVGCEHGVCGACTVLLEGEPVRSCLLFAVQAADSALITVEALASDSALALHPLPPLHPLQTLHPLQQAFQDAHALQCGFCTPGILLSLLPFLDRARAAEPSEAEVRAAL